MRVRFRHLVFPAGFAAGALAMALGGGTDRTFAEPAPAHASIPIDHGTGRFGPYPAEVLRVIDGDTLEVRLSVWPGQQVVTKVRLRGIDTPERRGRCAAERALAERATQMLSSLVERRPVMLSGIGPDKYFGRVVAQLLLADGRDAGATLLAQGLARHYAGRARQGWCG